ncbi:1-acyl-sn-glycerol-3-phosphate acyltransferase [Solihabitans fulvus]|uniref:1-acyl-sn-glycerol-3-phosphate acyltransferase n=1 Tax=Solihabitans fulvus TaxID=1892852 RepID=A0A5B2X9L4_9PSEU|nr:lysophospholipid acyltransferase family protein [Solihabitans fulvus]KAA2259542.1 1-acyl-sn-glycerol-3-phosphate acyltransferase [Solihabitans fulvus]
MTTHAWMPQSPCGAGCVEGAAPSVTWSRRVARAVAAGSVLLGAVGMLLAIVALPGSARAVVLRGWFRLLLRAFGVRLRVVGADRFQGTAGRGVLVASNHVSWLDEVALDAVQPLRMVAKRDIRSWPVLGRLVAAAGTVFLDRERLRLLPGTVAELGSALRDGAAVGIHPEGTTWCGLASGRFRPALFQAALDAGVPVRPVALRYVLADGAQTSTPAFVGDETLLDAIGRVLRLRGLVVEVHVLDEIAPGRAVDRRELAALAQAAVDAVSAWDIELPGQRTHGHALAA